MVMTLFISNFYRMIYLPVTNQQVTADLVTFTEEILNGKPHVQCHLQSGALQYI